MKPDHEIRIGSRTYGIWLLPFGLTIVRCMSASYSLQDVQS